MTMRDVNVGSLLHFYMVDKSLMKILAFFFSKFPVAVNVGCNVVCLVYCHSSSVITAR